MTGLAQLNVLFSMTRLTPVRVTVGAKRNMLDLANRTAASVAVAIVEAPPPEALPPPETLPPPAPTAKFSAVAGRGAPVAVHVPSESVSTRPCSAPEVSV